MGWAFLPADEISAQQIVERNGTTKQKDKRRIPPSIKDEGRGAKP
jgi:hypothetical protein